MPESVTIVGGGLAGCEAAFQLARRGFAVRLVEMKPARRTPAQSSDHLAELVCSNSLRSQNPLNAVGLLKEEMRRLGSVIIATATACRVPAGDALAVDRHRFGAEITATINRLAGVEVCREVVTGLPPAEVGPVIIATGPLTADELAADLQRLTGAGNLHFYDAIAPIVSGDSIDLEIAYAASRYGKGESSDYLNCPLDRAEYDAFYDALVSAECLPFHDFEPPRFFEGCLPIEEAASRGRDTLRFGCFKPVGLTDPRTGRRPHAVVQLRREDVAGQAFNLVGCQTKMRRPDQRRVFRLIPGLGRAELLRFGALHRNTFLDSPALLDDRGRLGSQPNLRFAGQLTGVEGYVESAAHGLVTALLLASELSGRPIPPPPRECALGALWSHVTGAARIPGRAFEPQNVNWGLFPPLAAGSKKADKKRLRVQRAIEVLEQWAATNAVELTASRID